MSFGRPKTGKPPLDETGLLDYAVKSLGSRMKSERDLRRLMTARAEPGEEGRAAMDSVIGKLKELGYLSDERFAADFTRLRQENDKFGRRRVQQGLMQKGVAQANVTEAVRKPENDKETARAMRRLVAAGFSTKAVWAVLRGWGSAVEEAEMDGADDI